MTQILTRSKMEMTSYDKSHWINPHDNVGYKSRENDAQIKQSHLHKTITEDFDCTLWQKSCIIHHSSFSHFVWDCSVIWFSMSKDGTASALTSPDFFGCREFSCGALQSCREQPLYGGIFAELSLMNFGQSYCAKLSVHMRVALVISRAAY